MNIRSIIIDDEISNLENLSSLLKEYCPNVEVAATADSAEKGLLAITQYRPDLVFLDIEMPRKNGFDLLESLPKIDFEVIFVTAFDQYAMKAIRFCALDYLLKPVHIFELTSSINRMEQRLLNRQENKRLAEFMVQLQQPALNKKIALSMADEIVFVEINHIMHCQGENNYTYVYLNSGKKILVSKTLKEFEDLLTDHGFLRVHRAYLVNINFIKSFVRKEGGYILMEDDTQISISRNRKEDVLKLLKFGLNK